MYTRGACGVITTGVLCNWLGVFIKKYTFLLGTKLLTMRLGVSESIACLLSCVLSLAHALITIFRFTVGELVVFNQITPAYSPVRVPVHLYAYLPAI